MFDIFIYHPLRRVGFCVSPHQGLPLLVASSVVDWLVLLTAVIASRHALTGYLYRLGNILIPNAGKMSKSKIFFTICHSYRAPF